ncbi:hypothetical protein NHX12_017542 [Muraenolepis orangiensis]|uniref:DUF4585 domain-containing protein n=1 Tax=Muraenolepis orangiensis TaxID=630683 RepID=A0A9Q0EV37_9TELE|nr:hypothetical protein NHX12_017542 [Muraenolepis orangiensis]
MEAVENTVTYRDDTGPYGKLLPENDKCPPETEHHEPNYVDLVDMKSEGVKPVKVTFTGEGEQPAVIQCDSSTLVPRDHPREDDVISRDFLEEYSKDKWGEMTVTGEPPEGTRLTGKVPDAVVPVERGTPLPGDHGPGSGVLPGDHGPRSRHESTCTTSDDLEYTDMYLNGKTESDHDDDASEVLSDHCESDRVEDESHYITTHEIQLTELDHDVDYDLGRGDCEDDNLVYTFVDYALFDSAETQGDGSKAKNSKTQLNIGHPYQGAVVGAEQESDSDNSSDESVCKNEGVNQNPERLIHLSIKPAPRTEDSSDNVSANSNLCGHVQSAAEYRGRFLTNVNRLCDFIPAPGRQHLPTKLRGKDVNSSGASSSISELDDADKEVRNLTSKTFRSLACPYFDAINLSTSSESSVSEYGLGWAAYVNLNHGNISQKRERGVLAHKSSSATFALNKAADRPNKESHVQGAHTKMYATNRNVAPAKQAAVSSIQTEHSTNTKQTEQPPWGDVITLTETINFHVEAELPESKRHSKCFKSAYGGSRTKDCAAKGNTQKRASSHLKNVISKKMQFEHERKLERGDYSTHSPCLQCREQEHSQGRSSRMQSSESGSEFTVNSLDEIGFEGTRPHSCEAEEDEKNTKSLDNKAHFPEHGGIEKPDSVEPTKAQLNHSQCSAFTLLKGESEPRKEPQSMRVPNAATTVKEVTNGSGVVNKLSHLFVPSSLLLSKEKEFEKLAITHSGKEPSMDRNEHDEKVAKPPEIKIRLRNANENKGHMLNIANLLTPKISNTVKTLKTTGYSRLQVLSAPDRIPHFTVRDMRENKCKFQMPIYHVRDVRKLVKSSYSFVSADNRDNKCPTSAAAAAVAEVYEDTSKKDSIKHVSPSPIYIKCNSVKTNGDGKEHPATTESSQQKPVEASSFSPKSECSTSHWSVNKGTPTVAKQLNPDLQRQERQTGVAASDKKDDPKVPNQAALEKLQAAVKTMEQLYVFDRNEWKRKSHAPQPVSHSHVLSLIASEEHGAEDIAATTGGLRAWDSDAIADSRLIPQTSMSETGKDRRGKGIVHVPLNRDPISAEPQLSRTYCKKSMLHLDNSKKKPLGMHLQNKDLPQSALSQAACTLKSVKTPGAPQLLKIEVHKDGRQVDSGKSTTSPTTATVTPSNVDHGNYLTIPRQGYTSEIKLLHPPNAKADSTAAKPKTGNAQGLEGSQTLPLALHNHPPNVECSSTTIYHHHRFPASPPQGPPQSQPLRFSPSASSLSPSPGAEPAASQTQRKMLLDLTTGYYYLVDTPLQPATKRLFDPETGHYVDVPVSHSPVSPIPLSPLTLSPGAYTPTYMIYPGLIPPSPALTPHAETLLSAAGDTSVPILPLSSFGKHGQRHETGATGAESPYYSATAEATHTHMPTLQLPAATAMAAHVTSRGSVAADTGRKPVISITTQQGPRIIAPPSFDGTTMSFVVEHR